MTKLDIKTIEKKTGRRIRYDTVSIGFDTAPAFTGICILKSDKKNVYIEHLEVLATSKKDDHFHRADHYTDALEKFKQFLGQYRCHRILVIERCYYGKNVESLIKLAHFGILTYHVLKKCFDTYYYYGATTARSIIGFNQKRQETEGTLKAKVYTRDTKDKKGKIKHKKGEKKKIKCKDLVHNYLETDFNVKIKNPDEADAFVLSLAGLLS